MNAEQLRKQKREEHLKKKFNMFDLDNFRYLPHPKTWRAIDWIYVGIAILAVILGIWAIFRILAM